MILSEDLKFAKVPINNMEEKFEKLIDRISKDKQLKIIKMMSELESFQIFHPKYDYLLEKLRPMADAFYKLSQSEINANNSFQFAAFLARTET
jgi:hypothetical protein